MKEIEKKLQKLKNRSDTNRKEEWKTYSTIEGLGGIGNIPHQSALVKHDLGGQKQLNTKDAYDELSEY